jgi:hypothetical protein
LREEFYFLEIFRLKVLLLVRIFVFVEYEKPALKRQDIYNETLDRQSFNGGFYEKQKKLFSAGSTVNGVHFDSICGRAQDRGILPQWQ